MDGAVKHDTDDTVGDDDSGGASVCENSAGTDKQTCTYRTSNRNHLQMATLELALEWGVGGVGSGGLDVKDLGTP